MSAVPAAVPAAPPFTLLQLLELLFRPERCFCLLLQTLFLLTDSSRQVSHLREQVRGSWGSSLGTYGL